jgi:hypothetical protein
VVLGFFRLNDPYRLLGLLLLLLLMSLPFFMTTSPITSQELKSFIVGEALVKGKWMYFQVVDFTAPLAAAAFGVADFLFGRLLMPRQVLAVLLIFFQASFFAILLINNKAYNDSTYVPALIFGTLCFFSFDLLSFSPELLASTVMLWVLNNLFKEIEFRVQRDEIMLNLGFFLGVATLIIFSYVIFLPAIVTILFVFTRPTARKLGLLFFGFLLPHGLLVTLYFFRGEAASLWQNFYSPSISFKGEMLVGFKSIMVLAALPTAYFVCSLFMLNREARFTKYQSQLFQVMFLWLIFCVVQAAITPRLSPHSLITFIPPLAYFISHYLLLIRRKWIAETMFLIFFIGILGINLGSRYGWFTRVRYDPMMVTASSLKDQVRGQRVMVLDDDPGIYLNNTLAAYFLDWSLSRKTLESPQYYENVMLVNEAFTVDPPDVIIDPNNLMKAFFDHLPTLQARYVRDGILYRRKKLSKVGFSATYFCYPLAMAASLEGRFEKAFGYF